MLKNFLLFGLLCFGLSNVNAQCLQSVQIAGGVNYANMDWQLPMNNIFNEHIPGRNAAISVNFLNHKIWSINTAFKYIEMGGGQIANWHGNETAPGTGEEVLIDYRMEYLSFSPRIAAQKTIKDFGIIAKAGPSVSYMLSEDFPDVEFNPINYGADIGLELRYQFMSSLFVSLETMYYYHLNELYANEHVSVKNGNNIGVLIGLGYVFGQ